MRNDTRTNRRYLGGTRNLDGAVTRTTTVEAATPEEARQGIASRLSAINRRFGYPPVSATEIGLQVKA